MVLLKSTPTLSPYRERQFTPSEVGDTIALENEILFCYFPLMFKRLKTNLILKSLDDPDFRER